MAILSRSVELHDVCWVFFSHQDPDVCSAIPLWAEITSSPVVLPEPWYRFVLHLGDVEHDRLVTIPDTGGTLPLGNGRLTVVPSHFLHSSAAHSLWDPRSGILYSADIGASKFPTGGIPDRIGRFSQVVDHLSGYHRRFMVGNRACRAWVRRVRTLA